MNGMMGVWNYARQDYDYIESLPDDAEALRPYIPQDMAAQHLFSAFVEMGDEPRHAMIKVIKAALGLPAEV